MTTGTGNGFSPDLLNTRNAGIYIRKKSDDKALGNNALYIFSTSANTPRGFQQSAAPIVVMRYAEVLLNFAEAAANSGHVDEALKALQTIRERVGYTADNNYGLQAITDRQTATKAVLYERLVELAYEGKAFDDIRRWMLFDGGQGQEALKAEWKLNGFGGNTNRWLHLTESDGTTTWYMNGQKRHNIVVYTELRADEKAREEVRDADGNTVATFAGQTATLQPGQTTTVMASAVKRFIVPFNMLHLVYKYLFIQIFFSNYCYNIFCNIW